MFWQFDDKNPFALPYAEHVANSETDCLQFAFEMMFHFLDENSVEPNLSLIRHHIVERWHRADEYRISLMPDQLRRTWLILSLRRHKRISLAEATRTVWEALIADGNDIDLTAIEQSYKRTKRLRPNFRMFRLDSETLTVEHFDAFEGI